MSSLVRRTQRSQRRKFQFMGRGTQLGVHNGQDKALLARLAREARHGKGPKS